MSCFPSRKAHLLDFARLQQLDSIAEGIEDVHPIESREWFVRNRRKPGVPAPRCEFGEAAHEDCRVRFASGVEVAVDAEMQAKVPAAKPYAAAWRQIRRFRLLNQPENAGIEGSRGGFLSRRHRKLNVIEAKNFRHG
jgi:hypothetical protein